MKIKGYLIIYIVLFSILIAFMYFTRADAGTTPADNYLNSVIAAYANEFALTYPDALNIAHECRISQSGKYYNSTIHRYAVTCLLPSRPGSFGVVMLDSSGVYDAFSVDADSQSALSSIMAQIGYK